MAENKHTMSDLYQMQSLPLSAKIRMTEYRIQQWIDEFGTDGVYVSFSGGKDSTVLLDIVRIRMNYPQIPAVYVDTGLEYPEIRDFVKQFDNVIWLRPKLTFKEVIEKYGYPFISKEVSLKVRQAKGKPDGYASKSFDGSMAGGRYDFSKYKFLLDAPFKVEERCCDVMKKNPTKKFTKETGRMPIVGQMASESILRTQKWLQNGCNAFDLKHPISNPMSFWTDQDVLLYIKTYNIPICSVYGDIVEDVSGTDNVVGQLTISDLEGFENMQLFDAKRPPLKTTGCKRTGCMFCGYGCHLKNDDRFVQMKKTHPKQYDYIMRKTEDGGLNYKEVIDWLNKHGNLGIRY